MKRTTDADAAFAAVIVEALAGQQCTLVRESYPEQLVVGFGPLRPADWPLRTTMHARWLLYSSYGSWEVSDGVHPVASDAGPLDQAALQRIRAVLFNQHVRATKTVAPGELVVDFDNGARLGIRPDVDAAADEDAWTLKGPGVLIEAWPDGVTVSYVTDDEGVAAQSNAAVHRLLRHVADRLGLTLFEPAAGSGAGFDGVLTARDGTVVVVQVGATATRPPHELRAVVVPKHGITPTSTDIDVTAMSPDAVAAAVRKLLPAA